MTRFPIADAALDDRIAILGTSGSGKTYLTTTAIERLMTIRARVVAVDPLGVMWGLRLKSDGTTPSGFNMPIFGGKHGDLPLNEHAGALIGETVATMAESCIIDLSELPTKSAERRFMTAFLEAVYRHTDPSKADPYHLIIDEADRFAPQKPPAGDETMLNRMEEIVRRGRAKGFIPWLITQRPAVLNKNVLSQADGLVMLKLTSSQDREQVGAWIEGQADRAQGKTILGSLPTMQRGQGVVWIPGRGVLETVQFPAKTTFDSSASPKRGEKKRATELKPLDLGALKTKLATVEAETKSNDPKALKDEIARLKAELSRAPAASKPVEKINTVPARAVEAAMREAHGAGFVEGWGAGDRAGWERGIRETNRKWEAAIKAIPVPAAEYVPQAATRKVPQGTIRDLPAMPAPVARSVAQPAPRLNGSMDGLATSPRRVLNAVGFWKAIGHDAPTREQVAAVAGYSPSSGGFNNLIGGLKTGGYLEIPQPGRVALSASAPYEDMTPDEARTKMRDVLSAPQIKLLDAALRDSEISRDDLGAKSGYSPSSGGFNNLIGSLSTLGIFVKPAPGYVAVSDWAREVLS